MTIMKLMISFVTKKLTRKTKEMTDLNREIREMI